MHIYIHIYIYNYVYIYIYIYVDSPPSTYRHPAFAAGTFMPKSPRGKKAPQGLGVGRCQHW